MWVRTCDLTLALNMFHGTSTLPPQSPQCQQRLHYPVQFKKPLTLFSQRVNKLFRSIIKFLESLEMSTIYFSQYHSKNIELSTLLEHILDIIFSDVLQNVLHLLTIRKFETSLSLMQNRSFLREC